jgi:hypothetical protein
MTKQNPIVTKEIRAGIERLNAGEGSLREQRMALGKLLFAAGFNADTDYAAKSAKEAGRADVFDTVKEMAVLRMPQTVQDAFNDKNISGEMHVTGAGSTLPYSKWRMQIPGKCRDLRAIQEAWEIAEGKRPAPEAQPRQTVTPLERDTEWLANRIAKVGKAEDDIYPEASNAAASAAYALAKAVVEGKTGATIQRLADKVTKLTAE